jgi:phospholipase C
MWERLEQRRTARRERRPDRPARPRPDLPAGSDLIPQIKHIVILMMAGHSYDNYLGMMRERGDGLPLGGDGAPDVVNSVPDGRQFHAHRLTSTRQITGEPTDTRQACDIQYDGGSSDGFAASVLRTVPGGAPAVPLGYWTEDDLPFCYSLARVFPVADRWFSSFLGPSYPNRRFLVAGTANGLSDDRRWNPDRPAAGTILNLLTAHGISWVNYQGSASSLAILVPRLLGKHGLIFGRSVLRILSAVNPFRAASIQDQLAFTADVYPLGLLNAVKHVRKIEQFFRDAAAGVLPAVSIVDPDFAAYSGRAPQDVGQAESFVAKVVNACMRGPGWEGTLLLWLQDNHGGYYDHVPPPPAVAPDDVPVAEGFHFPDNRFPLVRRMLRRLTLTPYARQLAAVDSGRIAYDRYGFRVPAVVVSPYARKDFVLHDVLDHTSVLKLIQEKWNLPPLTRRDAAAISPLGALDLGAPPAFLTPPMLDLAEPRSRLAAPGKLPPVVDAAAAFRIETARDFPVRIFTMMAVWAATLLAFSWSLPWLQVIILVYGTYLAVTGMRLTEFWKMWVFWLPQRRRTRQVAAYNAIFAFITLSAFCALLSSVLYLYVPVHIAAHRPGGNILWMYTGTYIWNLAEAVPALEIPSTLHWTSPMQASGLWGELFLLVFRLLVLTPVLALIVESIRVDNSEAKAERKDPPPGP